MLMLIFITILLSLLINDVQKNYILQIAPILPQIPRYDNYCFDLF